MKNDLVKKSNSLTEAHYFLTVAEYRILHMAFSSLAECDVNPEFFRNVRFTIKAKDYMELYGVDRTTAYQALRDASERLFDRYFTYDELVDEDLMLYERIKSRWVTKIGYQDDQAYITFFLSDDVLSMVGSLKEQYTYLNLYKFAGLTSVHAIRVYEMLMQWRKTKVVPIISLEELRLRLGIEDGEYPRMYDFKKYVLDMAINQINEHTDIIASYEQMKEGRKITGFKFSYKNKEKQAEALPSKPKNENKVPDKPDIFNGLSDAERNAIQTRIDEYIRLVESRGEPVSDFYRQNITKKAVAERWGLDVLAKAQEQEQERKERKAKARAEKQAEQERLEQQRQQAELRKSQMVAKFESLPPEQQEYILDEVRKRVGGAFRKTFDEARENHTAHTDTMFSGHFYEFFDV